MILAEKITILRKKNGWSQEELAEKLGVSRQSVSKYESAQSMPDLEKILTLSRIFGVSTDYLIRDELEEEPMGTDVPMESSDTEESVRKVSLEEANEFLRVKRKTTRPIALGVVLCILSPICLMLLGALSEGTGKNVWLSENVAAGIGITVLLLMVATAVAIFIYCGMQTKAFEYLEKERIETAYGVDGMVRESMSRFQDTYVKNIILGVTCCVLSPVPLFAGLIFGEGDLLMVCMVCVLLALVAVGVYSFIKVGIPHESMKKLLQIEEYTWENKRKSRRLAPFSNVYWLILTAIYLGISFYTDSWETSWIVWPVGGVLFAAIYVLLSVLLGNEKKKEEF